jgi:hydroxymethylglutaryl-CoA synthase
MRGIIGIAGYVPYRRLQLARIGETLGTTPAKGTRAVASFDEDPITMGVAAARTALASVPDAPTPDTLWFASSAPPYADRTNATTVHAALRLPRATAAWDATGSVRAGAGTLVAALRGTGTTLVVAADCRTGLPGGPDEATGGDGAAAVLIGDDNGDGGAVIAECVATASVTDEFVDRWRSPGDAASKVWEERFGEGVYVPLGADAIAAALTDAGVDAADLDHVIVTGPHQRACSSVAKRLGVTVENLAGTVGFTGAAHAALLLARTLEKAEAGALVAVVSLADGADVIVLRVTDAKGNVDSVDDQIAAGDDSLPYGKFLAWRGMLRLEPPRRPEPARASSSAAHRNSDWKFGFVGSRDRASGALHLPPQRVSRVEGAVDDMEPAPMADATGTIVTFTVDRLAYSPSPPIVFAVVDFDGGGRLPCELTDVNASDVAIGDRVEMTFRKVSEADGIRNYFWKARPLRERST